MLNYRKIRRDLMKRYEKGKTIRFFMSEEKIYVQLYDFCIVMLPQNENPFDLGLWEAEPEMAYMKQELRRTLRARPVNRFTAGAQDMLHMVRAEDRENRAWYPQTIFSLLAPKGDYSWAIDKTSKVLYVTAEPEHVLEIVALPGYVNEEEEEQALAKTEGETA